MLFDFLDTVNARCAEVGLPDIETVKAAGERGDHTPSRPALQLITGGSTRPVKDMDAAAYAQSGARMKTHDMHRVFQPPRAPVGQVTDNDSFVNGTANS
jgi:hypothetical protein